MIIIAGARYLLYFVETQVIGVWLAERKYNIDKIFTKLYHISELFTRREGDHGFQRVNTDIANPAVFIHKVIKKRYSVQAFALHEIGQCFIITHSAKLKSK